VSPTAVIEHDLLEALDYLQLHQRLEHCRHCFRNFALRVGKPQYSSNPVNGIHDSSLVVRKNCDRNLPVGISISKADELKASPRSIMREIGCKLVNRKGRRAGSTPSIPKETILMINEEKHNS
jgi:hypothetical protein